ncbi:hypothetical protein [Limnovirga soli]|uniref:Tetratricopeptide repeat protein n=1 Tax=Limnovirga soli TaxID=2656915 RepID=A0A8J8JQ74_9BACT|nr:hypothetical protein [Limnovirga soli]NNV54422.1 hypothetical protein [Limnovirga soli]
MKKLLLSAAIFCTIAVQAQSDKFAGAMEKTLTQLGAAKTTAELKAVSAAFERIGEAEKTQWLPYYYAGLALTNLGWMDQSIDKDANGDKVKELCDKAEAIEPNSEISTLRNMAATQQMMVDPQSRWQTYGMEAGAALEKGIKLDPTNPRLYYLQGMSVFNTPEQFGGGKEKAKPLFAKAVELFKAAQVKPLYPSWGQKQAEDMLAQCN